MAIWVIKLWLWLLCSSYISSMVTIHKPAVYLYSNPAALSHSIYRPKTLFLQAEWPYKAWLQMSTPHLVKRHLNYLLFALTEHTSSRCSMQCVQWFISCFARLHELCNCKSCHQICFKYMWQLLQAAPTLSEPWRSTASALHAMKALLVFLQYTGLCQTRDFSCLHYVCLSLSLVYAVCVRNMYECTISCITIVIWSRMLAIIWPGQHLQYSLNNASIFLAPLPENTRCERFSLPRTRLGLKHL